MREETIRLSQLSLTRSYRQISDCGEFTLVSVNGRSAYSDVHSVVPVPLIALDDHPPGHFFGIYPHGNGAWRQCTGCGDNRGAGRARRTTIGPLTPLRGQTFLHYCYCCYCYCCCHYHCCCLHCVDGGCFR